MINGRSEKFCDQDEIKTTDSFIITGKKSAGIDRRFCAHDAACWWDCITVNQ
jgi:NAD-dependent dihydropyrimidine dehydrogenase PreA subunit